MKTIRLASLVLLLLILPTAILAGEESAEVVPLDSGPIRGRIESGVRVFLGIPFAAPPVGALRWRAPQEVAPWKQVRECTSYGASCPQPQQTDTRRFNEDCLYLNVWSPAGRADAKLPVMVWIHGGAFNFGSGSLAEYDGKNLARKGVVMVTINYRLGPLGFMVHPSLSRESALATSGNYGLLDQIAALKWVKRNISALGGDPGRVTIIGESAGSKSVALLMISPLAAGLFHGAIAESGGPILGSEFMTPAFNGDMANVERMSQVLVSRLGCDKTGDVLAAMRSKSAEEIVKKADCVGCVLDDKGLYFAPVFDGQVLPRDPVVAYSSGKQHDVPIIIGTTLNEGYWFFQNEEDLSVEKYRAFLQSRFGEAWEKAFEMFPARTAGEVAPTLDRVLTVASVAQPSRFVAQSMERKKSRAFLYQFTRRPDTALARKMGVHHGVDIAYVFGNMEKSARYDATDVELSRKLMDYWVNFARTGNPNGKGLVEWPAYASSSDLNLELGDIVRTHAHLWKKECDFISRLPAYRSAVKTALRALRARID